MSQNDSIVEMLSEQRAGSKLKRMSIVHSNSSPFPNLSQVNFVFEGDKDEERVVVVWGKDLGVGFGRQEI